jgi:penicillin-binding protein 2
MSLNLPSLAELRDTRVEIQRFQGRVLVVQWVVLFCFLLLASRLAYLQLVRHEDLMAQAESNRTAILPTVPPRGTILDRNGVVLASNYSAYTLEITPSKVKDLEATINELAELVDIQTKDRRRFKRLREESKSFDSLPIRNRLTDEEVARFSAQSYRFPGVEIKARLFRQYPYSELASHVIGYIGRINQRDKERLEEEEDAAANYRGTEYIGKLGVEQRYERELHGITGVNEVETSAGGRAT